MTLTSVQPQAIATLFGITYFVGLVFGVLAADDNNEDGRICVTFFSIMIGVITIICLFVVIVHGLMS